MRHCYGCQNAIGPRRGSSCPVAAVTPDKWSVGCDLYQKPPTGPQAIGPADSKHALSRPEPVMHPAKPAKLEKDLQRFCEHELTRRGIWFLHLSPMAREKQGCPDLLFAVRGQACAVELKIESGRVSEAQSLAHIAMMRDGWRVDVCFSFVEFLKFLEGVS